MSELAKLDEIIDRASAALESSADGHFARQLRAEIVGALGERLGPSGPPSNAIGYLRRVRLAVLGIEKVKPIWAAAFPDEEIVDLALDLTEQVAIGDVSMKWATGQHGNFWTHCDDLGFHGHGLNSALLVGYGAAQTLAVAIWDWNAECTGVRRR